MKLFFKIIIVLFLIFGLLYSWFWISDFFKPQANMQNINTGQKVNLEDGIYKFKVSDVNNTLKLDYSKIEVKSKEITSMFSKKEYNGIWDDGYAECLLDLSHIKKRSDIPVIDSAEDYFNGYIGREISPFKIYVQVRCEKISENIANLTISLLDDENLNIDDKKYKEINSSVIDNRKWSIDKESYVNLNINKELDNKPYKFLNHSLGDKVNVENLNSVYYNGLNLYKLEFYGFENHVNKEKDAELDYLVTNTKFIDLKNLANHGRKLNYIEPEKFYVSLSAEGFINGMYALDNTFNNYTDRVQLDSTKKCISKMNNYADYLLSTYPIESTTIILSLTDEFNTIFVDQSNFKAVDKINHVSIELSCQNSVLYRGTTMSIKFEKNK